MAKLVGSDEVLYLPNPPPKGEPNPPLKGAPA